MHRIKQDSDKGDIKMYNSNNGFNAKNKNGDPYGESRNMGSNNAGFNNSESNARSSRNEKSAAAAAVRMCARRKDSGN